MKGAAREGLLCAAAAELLSQHTEHTDPNRSPHPPVLRPLLPPCSGQELLMMLRGLNLGGFSGM